MLALHVASLPFDRAKLTVPVACARLCEYIDSLRSLGWQVGPDTHAIASQTQVREALRECVPRWVPYAYCWTYLLK